MGGRKKVFWVRKNSRNTPESSVDLFEYCCYRMPLSDFMSNTLDRSSYGFTVDRAT